MSCWKSFRVTFVSAILLLLTSNLQAATYYVSTSGSNSNSCATATAGPPAAQSGNKLTIVAGIACMAPGDTLLVRAGTYTSTANVMDTASITIPSGSSWNTATKIWAYPMEDVTIRPPDGSGGITLRNQATSYVWFKDFIIDMINITVSGSDNGPDGVYIGYGSNHIRLETMEIENNYGNGIQMADFNGNSPFNEVLGSFIHDNGRAPGIHHGYGMYISTSDNLFDHNEIYNNGGYGAHFYDNVGEIYINRNTITNNRWYNNGTHGGSNCGFLILGDAHRVYNNVVYNNAGVGICLYTNATNILISNNTITGNTEGGISMQYYSVGNVITNNIIYNNLSGVTEPIDQGTGYTASVYTDHNFYGNPSFVNPSINNYAIPIGSLARDGATVISGITVDINGVPRSTGGSPDYGAYEYVAAGGGSIQIVTTTVPTATVGSLYNKTLLTTGGTDPKVFSISAGTLPNGLSLDPTGFIYGVPVGLPGAYTVTARVDENGGTNDTQILIITVVVETLPIGRPIFSGPLRQEIQTFRRGSAPTCADRVAKGDEWTDISLAVPVRKVSTTTCPTAPVWVVP
jgi:parallel beta-helix repeat protein